MEKVIYVRAVPEGGVVSRYGTGTRERANALIGAVRDADDPRRLTFTGDVVALPFAEFRKYKREYMRAVEEGALEIVPEPEPVPQGVEQPAPTEQAPKAKSKRS